MMKNTETFGQFMKNTMVDVMQAMVKAFMMQEMLKSGFGKDHPILSAGVTAFTGGMLSFASGGIIPGSFSQPVPIMAHGSEVVLNPGQQNTLMDIINGGGKGTGNEQTSQPIIIANTFKIQTLDGSKAADVIMGQKQLIQQMVADGIRGNNNGLKTAVRTA
jgi:hypothetical protein